MTGFPDNRNPIKEKATLMLKKKPCLVELHLPRTKL